MHEMLTIFTDVCGICLSVVTWLKWAAARAVYAGNRVCGVIWCILQTVIQKSLHFVFGIIKRLLIFC